MKWVDLVPADVAKRQRTYDRRVQAIKMDDLGYSNSEIGKSVGVTYTRALQLIASGRRLNVPFCLSPVELWMLCGGEVAELARKLKRIE